MAIWREGCRVIAAMKHKVSKVSLNTQVACHTNSATPRMRHAAVIRRKAESAMLKTRG